jgi:TPR repeat protein
MKQPVVMICIIILFCYPLSTFASTNDECSQASRRVKKEMWTGVQLHDSVCQAIKLCLVSANEGSVIAQYNLAMLYTLENDNQENEKAYEWILKAANNGHPYSQFHLGTMYEKGIVVKHNFKKADKWYEKAAQNGLLLAKKKLEERQKIKTDNN